LPDDAAAEAVRSEANYLRRLAEEQTPVEVHLVTGESFRGFIEYYDRRFIRLTRRGAPNLFIFKHDIKYLSELSKDA
jgi:RNA chaperone Hfq